MLLLAGYSTIPKSISGNGVAVNPVTFEQLSLAPGLYQDQVVRVGGKVINVINLPTKTILELAVQPLNSLAHPEIHYDFPGRVLGCAL
ncbi:Slp family lipoprotein [Klebsiella variicola]